MGALGFKVYFVHTQGIVEPGGQQLQQVAQAAQHGQRQLVVGAQVGQDGAQAGLQQLLGQLRVVDDQLQARVGGLGFKL